MTTATSEAAHQAGERRPSPPAAIDSGYPGTLSSQGCQSPCRKDRRRRSRNESHNQVPPFTPLGPAVPDRPLQASEYDRWFDGRWGKYAFGVELGSVLAAVGPLSPTTRVLDAGCGTGRLAAAIEARGASVVGLDLDRQMLDIAVTRTEGHVIAGDAHRIPCADGIFDCAVAVTLCEFAGRPDEVFAELARVTRPGGLVLVGALNPRSSWGLRKWRQLHRPPWSEARFLSASALIALGRPFGRVSISGSLYAPGPVVGLRIFGPLLERMGRMVPRFGAFQLVAIERSAP